MPRLHNSNIAVLNDLGLWWQLRFSKCTEVSRQVAFKNNIYHLKRMWPMNTKIKRIKNKKCLREHVIIALNGVIILTLPTTIACLVWRLIKSDEWHHNCTIAFFLKHAINGTEIIVYTWTDEIFYSRVFFPLKMCEDRFN